MIERGGRPGFAFEALQRLRIFGQFVREELQGNLAPQANVLGPIDDAHAALAHLAQDTIVRNRPANQGLRRRLCGP